ncbi:MAG: carbohydrate kinase family protein [Acidobacteriota bacterium]
MEAMRKGIISGGNLIMDYVKIIDLLPQEGMLANIETIQACPGGAVHNCLVDLARFDAGIPLYAMGLVGTDETGRRIIDRLECEGIDTSMISVTDKAMTSYTDVMTVKSNGKRTFFHYRGANQFLDETYFERIDTNARIFHLGYLLLLDALDAPDMEFGTKAAKVLSLLKSKGYATSVDVVSEDSARYKDIILPSLKYVDYLTINEVEAERITGIDIRTKGVIDPGHLKSAAEAIMRCGVTRQLVIHFPEGALCMNAQGAYHYEPSIPMCPEDIKGTVGAGDAFCAGILYGVHENLSVKDMLLTAHASAHFNLKNPTSTGGAVSMKTIRELLTR